MADLQLDALEAKGLIRLATIDPELEYLFRHALVQDAAYGSLLKQERRALHREVGLALEELYPDRHGELAAVLARHFEQAEDAGKAIAYLVRAARYALDRNALVEAYDMYGRAEGLLPAQAADEPLELLRQRLEIRFGLVKAAFGFLDEDEQLRLLQPVIDDVDRLGDLRFTADVRLHDALLRMFRGQLPETSPKLAGSLRVVTEIADQLDDPIIAALPKSIIGLFQVFTGALKDGVAALAEAAPLLEQKRDFVGSSFALMALGVGLARLGRFEEAERASNRAVAVAEQAEPPTTAEPDIKPEPPAMTAPAKPTAAKRDGFFKSKPKANASVPPPKTPHSQIQRRGTTGAPRHACHSATSARSRSRISSPISINTRWSPF